MKKKMGFVAVLVCGVMLMCGCGGSLGAKFDASASLLEQFADKNGGIYADDSASFAETPAIDGVYVVEVENAHVELWDIDTTSNAAAWFKENVDIVKKNSSSSSGSHTTTGGDYSIMKSDGVFYRIMFSEDKGIYAYGEQDYVNGALISMGIAK